MGRKWVLFGFSLLGYVLGALVWVARGPAVQFIENIGISSDLAGGLIMGLMGSTVMVLSLLVWSFFSPSS